MQSACIALRSRCCAVLPPRPAPACSLRDRPASPHCPPRGYARLSQPGLSHLRSSGLALSSAGRTCECQSLSWLHFCVPSACRLHRESASTPCLNTVAGSREASARNPAVPYEGLKPGGLMYCPQASCMTPRSIAATSCSSDAHFPRTTDTEPPNAFSQNQPHTR